MSRQSEQAQQLLKHKHKLWQPLTISVLSSNRKFLLAGCLWHRPTLIGELGFAIISLWVCVLEHQQIPDCCVFVLQAYTAYGGLYISIITDQVQAMLTLSLIAILVIYCLARFRHTLKPSLVAVGTVLGPNIAGYGTIFSLPCSLMASTVFSEALWQKVWASKDRKSLVFGGTVGFITVTAAVFLFGFGGWIASWAGLINKNTNQNL